ncbi:Uma2 family endonuclease [Caulobacter sp. D4A]|uniref:Uma2 family endonuclease n=1 Tax=unclassified Caulobacter TaxID=2648921 RepID=UPI000D737A64|nr:MULTISPECIES: Uma2 family endonuclease [unclassified Caulobacter]PXA78555.1 Uma2 family endonuclease [Caulobacter sp. D4A]PXA90375.1 Uma2 family endonuclease [Caulobacter sp. D5]
MNAPGRPAETVTPYRFTYDDVLRMVEAGILAEDAHVELIEGELITVSPESVPHVRCRRWLTQFFTRRLAEGQWEVNSDAPARLDDLTAPEPDLAIFPSRLHDRDVRGADIVLAIEVSVSSQAFDLGRKAELYAQSGIREYWVVDVPGRQIVVHREPSAGGYRAVQEIGARGSVAPKAFPHLEIKVADLPLDD